MASSGSERLSGDSGVRKPYVPEGEMVARRESEPDWMVGDVALVSSGVIDFDAHARVRGDSLLIGSLSVGLVAVAGRWSVTSTSCSEVYSASTSGFTSINWKTAGKCGGQYMDKGHGIRRGEKIPVDMKTYHFEILWAIAGPLQKQSRIWQWNQAGT